MKVCPPVAIPSKAQTSEYHWIVEYRQGCDKQLMNDEGDEQGVECEGVN